MHQGTGDPLKIATAHGHVRIERAPDTDPQRHDVEALVEVERKARDGEEKESLGQYVKRLDRQLCRANAEIRLSGCSVTSRSRSSPPRLSNECR